MSRRLFGTDGVRGTAGQPPLDAGTIRRLGAALARDLPLRDGGPRILVGRDTRESGEWIERELAYGARTSGAAVVSAGVISTPAIAYLTRAEEFDAGLVISASHNPYEDNGIKVFSGAGEKFTETLEAQIEEIVADPGWQVPEGQAANVEAVDLTAGYLAHVRQAMGEDGIGRHHRTQQADTAAQHLSAGQEEEVTG
jgi:phosphoglucosamine mutase